MTHLEYTLAIRATLDNHTSSIITVYSKMNYFYSATSRSDNSKVLRTLSDHSFVLSLPSMLLCVHCLPC